MKTVGVIIPTLWEAWPVIRHFRLQKRRGAYEGTIGSSPVRLIVSGVGAERARMAAERLCRDSVRALVSAGFCGALAPDLPVGRLIVGRIATASSPVRTAAERAALAARANAVAADMETQAIVEAGTRRGVPIRAVRVVSDVYGDDLRPLFGDDAGWIAWRIAVRLLNPGAWPLLRRMIAQSRIARARLLSALPAELAAIDLPANHARNGTGS